MPLRESMGGGWVGEARMRQQVESRSIDWFSGCQRLCPCQSVEHCSQTEAHNSALHTRCLLHWSRVSALEICRLLGLFQCLGLKKGGKKEPQKDRKTVEIP